MTGKNRPHDGAAFSSLEHGSLRPSEMIHVHHIEPPEMCQTMSTSEIQALCYPPDLDLSRFSNRLESLESTLKLDDLRRASVEANRGVVQSSTSRQGKDFQRFSFDLSGSEDGQTGGFARLTTGAVPIMSDGRILLVSSGAKTSWVLPKGGWESDESLPVGAIRETFEEAGVVGVLGPPLPSLTYETRKARRRRLLASSSEDSIDLSPSKGSVSPRSIDSASTSSKSLDRLVTPDHDGSSSPSPPPQKEHTHNCMTIFPLYVTHVSDKWPETNRRRRVFTVEDAEDAVSSRPEFVTILKEIRMRQLHRLCLLGGSNDDDDDDK